MWLLIILIVIIILGVIEQLMVNNYILKNDVYVIKPTDEPKMYINPKTGNQMIVCLNSDKIRKEYKTQFSNKIKPKTLLITQISRPVYKFFNGLPKVNYITPLTDICGLVEPILKTAIRPNLKENYYSIYTNDNIQSIMFDNKICLFL